MRNIDYVLRTEKGDILVEKNAKEMVDGLIDKLIVYRKKNKITQQDISELTGISRANISRLEKKTYIPTLAVLMKYSNAIGKSLEINLKDL